MITNCHKYNNYEASLRISNFDNNYIYRIEMILSFNKKCNNYAMELN